jgi:alpha-N-acetylglucosamine transferase
MGFHVIVAPTPIHPPAIKFEFLRTKIEKNGCCGASELIKLNSYRLLEFDWVVHMDADTMLLNPIDELFEENVSLIYTTDPNMATHKGTEILEEKVYFLYTVHD